MKWKDTLVGAAVTLMVTIIAGLAIYFLTRQAPEKEALYYNIIQSATFGGSRTTATFITIEVVNSGRAPAHDVRLLARPSPLTPIRDKRLEPENAILNIVDHSNERGLDLAIPRLLPNERLTVSLLLDGRAEIRQISLRSGTSIGEPLPPPNNAEERNVFGPIIFILGLALLVQMGLLTLFRKSKHTPPAPFLESSGRNNTAFAITHAGFIDEAEELLRREMLDGAPGPWDLTNRAFIDHIRGNNDEADRKIAAALWWVRDFYQHDESHAFVLYIRSLVRGLRGDTDDALGDLRASVELPRSKATVFARNSIYFNELEQKDKRFAEVIETAEKKIQEQSRRKNRWWRKLLDA